MPARQAPRPRRKRPMCGYTLTPEVVAELRRRAEATGTKISRLADAALRAGLGLPPEPPTPASEAA